MTLQAVIFDIDGTLADTEEVHRQAFNATTGCLAVEDSKNGVRAARGRLAASRHGRRMMFAPDPFGVRASAPPLTEIESWEIPATQLKGWFP